MALSVHTRGEGRPVVILPSFGLDHSAMADAFEPLFTRAHGWSRWYVDLPGTGGSPPGEPRSDAVLDDVVDTVGLLVGSHSFLVAGWSYGGYLAIGLARRLPERIGGMLLICAGPKIRPADRNLTGVLPSVPEPGWLENVPADLHDYFSHSVGLQTAAVARRIAAVLARSGPAAEVYLAELRSTGFALSDEDTPTRCSAPVSIIAGRRDRVAGFAGLFEAMSGYDHADYLALAEAGHYLPVEQPDHCQMAALTWLGACGSFF
jgi:pimeloyl-ACP methyl ester carboxylesterase